MITISRQTLYIHLMENDKANILSLIKAAIHRKNPEAEVILFGSRARGQEHKHSDWDILVLLDMSTVDRKTEKEYREALFDVELETGEAISTFVFSRQDWESRHAISPLFENIQKDGVRL